VRYPIAGIIYLACVVVPLLRPWDGIGLYMLIAAIRPQNITYGLEVAGGRYSILTLGFILIGWAIRIPVLKPRWGAFHLLIILFAIQLLISRSFALDAFAAHEQFMMMFIPMVVSLIIVQVVKDESHVYRAMWFFAIGLGFLGYHAFWKAHFTNLYCIENDDCEIMGPGGMLVDRNDFALGLNMVIPILFYLALSSKRLWVKIFGVISMGPATIIVLESGSRGGFLGLAGVGCYILYKMHHKRWVLGLAVVAAIGGLMVLPPEYIDRLLGITSAAAEDSSAQGRLISWNAAIEMARQHPFTGVGLGCFTVDYFRYSPDASEAFVAHSSFFQILGTAGVTGAFLWVAIVIRMWQVLGQLERMLRINRMKGTRLHYMVLGLRTSLIAYVISGAFLSMEDLEFFYYEVGLAASLDLAVRAAIRKKKREEEERDRLEEERQQAFSRHHRTQHWDQDRI
jgi:putative inorganic carbon (hco3(-)) transporter